MMRISEVHISLIKPKDGLIGFASVVLEDSLTLGFIGIHKKLKGEGYRLTYPEKQRGHGSQTVFHPIRKGFSQAIEQAILTKLKNVMETGHDRHRCVDD